MDKLTLFCVLIVYISLTISNAQRNRNVRTCTPLKSNSLNIQCHRGFRKISCEERMYPGSKGNLACKPGFQLYNDPEFTQVNCGDDGIWDKCLFSCDQVCGNPTPVETEFKSDPPVKYLAGQYPWYAMVYTRTEELFNGTFMFKCGASIINHRMALTVAGCAYRPGKDLNDMRLVAGSSIFKWSRPEDEHFQPYEIEKVLVPKEFTSDAEGDPNDIAIILIKGSFTFSEIVKPICLYRNFTGPVEDLPMGTEGYLTGFNTDQQTHESIRFVYNITLAAINKVDCRNFEYPYKRYYESYDKFCAGNLSNGYNIPFGFIGGGYFIPEFKNLKVVYFLRGIAASYGRGVDFFAITDVNLHLPWILQQEKLHLIDDSENPPEFCGPGSRANGTLSLNEGSCRLPAMPSNGRYFIGGLGSAPVGSHVPEWSVLKYQCDRGYALRGSDTVFCNNGAWSYSPQCLQVCKPLTSFSLNINCSLNNKEVPCEFPMAAGTVADLSCKKGYTLHYAPDSTRITCGIDGSWSASPFKCTPECGLLTPKGGGAFVIGGSFVETGDFPWHAGIYEASENGSQFNKQICGGSIINAKMILSAAHCFYPTGGKAPYDKDRFAIAVGKIHRYYSDERDKFAQYSPVDRILIPPSYDDILGNYASDIAIVLLQFALIFTPYVRPICVQWDFRGHEEELKPGTPGMVAGWGLTSEGGEPSELLKSITLPSVPRYECRDNFPADFRPYLTPGKFCAGFQNGSSVCRGDSGGGLSFPQNVGQNLTIYFLRGVVSVGPTKDGTCDSSQYTVFTSVLAHLEWMKKYRAHTSV